MKMSFLRPAIIAAAAVAVTGCAENYYGRHAYVGADIAYAGPYYGWYDNYYYPGVGVYLYDRSGVRHRWSGGERHYWQTRRPRTHVTENWSGYGRDRPSQYRGHRRR
jgi:hypothetical protein